MREEKYLSRLVRIPAERMCDRPWCWCNKEGGRSGKEIERRRCRKRLKAMDAKTQCLP